MGEQAEKFCLGSLHRRFVSMHDVPRFDELDRYFLKSTSPHARSMSLCFLHRVLSLERTPADINQAVPFDEVRLQVAEQARVRALSMACAELEPHIHNNAMKLLALCCRVVVKNEPAPVEGGSGVAEEAYQHLPPARRKQFEQECRLQGFSLSKAGGDGALRETSGLNTSGVSLNSTARLQHSVAARGGGRRDQFVARGGAPAPGTTLGTPSSARGGGPLSRSTSSRRGFGGPNVSHGSDGGPPHHGGTPANSVSHASHLSNLNRSGSRSNLTVGDVLPPQLKAQFSESKISPSTIDALVDWWRAHGYQFPPTEQAPAQQGTARNQQHHFGVGDPPTLAENLLNFVYEKTIHFSDARPFVVRAFMNFFQSLPELVNNAVTPRMVRTLVPVLLDKLADRRHCEQVVPILLRYVQCGPPSNRALILELVCGAARSKLEFRLLVAAEIVARCFPTFKELAEELCGEETGHQHTVPLLWQLADLLKLGFACRGSVERGLSIELATELVGFSGVLEELAGVASSEAMRKLQAALQKQEAEGRLVQIFCPTDCLA